MSGARRDMAAPVRPSLAARKSSVRPPTMRPPPSRAQTATPSLSARASPSHSTSTPASAKSPAQSVNGGVKRKERDFDQEGGEETNINVVVRCRGRNDREVRENSGVVVSTDGVKGNKVELSMGPTALSNKTYQFDKVFSPAADQEMVFREVVSPILDEVLSGFNCTVFAYGQTGTGKTYTMTGDIADTQPLPEAAGIVPRVLYSLFDRLGETEGENSVKCSFIELYNEELRDLLSVEESTKLKIYDDNSKKGITTTLVQGMEESHIKSASKGLEILRNGSHKRQVAATKCNDLSSRSHTVFTITVFMKQTSETGEDFVCAGKLNLVDLAGSENIQRSGAENKRAAEAGLINKSLLTLGRVINALVEKSSHVPYRESKLTRLLQDSLGGRTKTCIIATLSPAKSNLEETISTLDYAFRAKNIRNKPQVNQTMSKKTLFKDFTAEIEKLKGELIATRQRNGVYLTQESFEEITGESESRRIQTEEQRDKIETLEANLRNKIQELFTLASNFGNLKKDSEASRVMLDGTKSLLQKTEAVLAHTQDNLGKETYLRKAHQETEEQLASIGHELLSTLESTKGDMSGLRSKIRRKSDLQAVNRTRWTAQNAQVSDNMLVIDQRLEELKTQQNELLSMLSSRMQTFVTDELAELQDSQKFLQDKCVAFQKSEQEVNVQTAQARDDMNGVLREIAALREDVRQKVGAGLAKLSSAAQRISAGITTELDSFHSQLHSSYASLGREFKIIFEDVIKQMNDQQAEANKAKQDIMQAGVAYVEDSRASYHALEQSLQAEKEQSVADRQHLLSQIGSLIQASAEAQDRRMSEHLSGAAKRIKTSEEEYSHSSQRYESQMDEWTTKSQALVTSCVRSREAVKSKIKADWSAANEQSGILKRTTETVHDETVQIVNGQMANMDDQLSALDEIISRVTAQNDTHHASHTSSLGQLSSDVQESYASVGRQMDTSYTRVRDLSSEMHERASALAATMPELGDKGQVRVTLSSLRHAVATSELHEYVPTGETPAKVTYSYSRELPRTSPHDRLLGRMRRASDVGGEASPQKRAPSPRKINSSPSKGVIYTDECESSNDALLHLETTFDQDGLPIARPTSLPSLREMDVNIVKPSMMAAPEPDFSSRIAPPPMKRLNTASGPFSLQVDSKLPTKRSARMTVTGVAEGRENLGASIGPGGGMGRKLRSRGSD